MSTYTHTLILILPFNLVAAIGLPHNAEVDSTLAGYDIPKNTIVMVNVYGIQMSEKYWDKPTEFIPERWLEEDGKTLKKNPAFILFGLGRRFTILMFEKFSFGKSFPSSSTQ